METWLRVAITSPVSWLSSFMDSISSPKSSTRMALSMPAGMMSIMSPRTRKVPRSKPMSLRVYCMSTSSRRMSMRLFCMPGRREIICPLYSSGLPRP